MSDNLAHGGGPELSRPEMMSALFANLVVQQTDLALMLMGRVPHPETGERVQDLDSARMLIDQLEMIEVKTRGNLDSREQQLLTQSLTALRMAFVETVEGGSAGGEKPRPSPGAASTAAASAPSGPSGPAASQPQDASEAESRKKFSKKY
jgi:hypothetical protein